MGWLHRNDLQGSHEGYIVGLLGSQNHVWKEMHYDGNHAEQPLDCVQAGCDCGWRSHRLQAPSGTIWVPHAVMAPDDFEEEARKLWLAHVEHELSQGTEVFG